MSVHDGVAVPSMKGSGQVPTDYYAVGLSMSDLDFEFNYEEDHDLSFSKLVQIEKQLLEYKSKTNRGTL